MSRQSASYVMYVAALAFALSIAGCGCAPVSTSSAETKASAMDNGSGAEVSNDDVGGETSGETSVEDGVDTSAAEKTPTGDVANAADASAAASPERCMAWAAPVAKGNVDNTKLSELSGLAASHTHGGLLWTHNDSGEKKAWIYGLDAKGHHIATLRLKGIEPEDWEDIAIGPCGGVGGAGGSSDCIVVADTGDNAHKRDEVQLLRIAEPAKLPTARIDDERIPRDRIDNAEVEVITLRYPKRKDLRGPARKEVEHADVGQ